jgi:cellulose biosynthesis protein BcsQ
VQSSPTGWKPIPITFIHRADGQERNVNAMLVTNHRGGVGKTFVSVHLAKILSESGHRVLLVDCDGQYDAFKFFAKHKGQDDDVHGIEINFHLNLLGNRHCKSLRSFGYEEENYDYIVLDGDASMTSTIKSILENEIRLVIAPVNFQANAVENLEDLFETIHRLNELHAPVDLRERQDKLARKRQAARSVASQLLIVPLAADEKKLDELLKKFRVKTKVKTHKNMPWMLEATNQSLTRGVPIWEVEHLSDEDKSAVRAYFTDLAQKVKRSFD